MRPTVRIATVVAWAWMTACGGKLATDSDTGGSGGGIGSTTGRNSGTTSSSGSTSTTVGGGGVGGGGSGSDCGSVCQRIVAAGCSNDILECTSQCSQERGKYPMCVGLFDQYLLCLGTAQFKCAPGTSEPQPRPCEREQLDLQNCANSTPPSPPPSVVDASVPPQCGNVPGPAGPMNCSGGGSATTSSGTGSQQTCTSECADGRGNRWSSTCVGTSCSCSYNGVQYCLCFTPGPACSQGGTCCPGAG